MKLAEILTGPDVWSPRGTGGVYGKTMCLWKAFAWLKFEERWNDDQLGREEERLRGIVPGGLPGVYNDTRGRTWDEVARVVDAYDRDRMLNP